MATTNPWYPDSGATHHCIANPNMIHNLTPYPGHEQLMIGNGTGMPISSFGHSFLQTHSFPLKLDEILHVLPLKKNLLFVKKTHHKQQRLCGISL